MIGKYRVVRTLGRGGFAWVYEVRDAADERPGALKLLDPPPHEQDADEFNERFLREARTIGSLRHPNIVEVRDFGVMAETGRPYMAMELLRGHDLQAELTRNGPLEPRRARGLFAGALDALGVAHAAGVVHKDLKPTNLFIVDPGSPSERMVLVDFGIAHASTDSRLTRAGTFTGTPAYAAPEYIRANLVTPALDVYQMGLVLSEALSGTECVPQGSPVQVIMAHLNGDILIPAALDETDLGPIVRKATSLDPANRYADGTEFRRALEAARFPETTLAMPVLDDFGPIATQAYHVLPVSSKKHQTVDVTQLVALPSQPAPAPQVASALPQAAPTGSSGTGASPISRRRVLAVGAGMVVAIAAVAAVVVAVLLRPSTTTEPVPGPADPPQAAVSATSSPERAGVVADVHIVEANRADMGRAVENAMSPPDGVPALDAGPDADASDTAVTLGPGVRVVPFQGALPARPPDDGIRPLRFGTATHAGRVARRAIRRGDWTRAIAACKQHADVSLPCAWALARAYRERGDVVSSCYWLAVAGFTTSSCE